MENITFIFLVSPNLIPQRNNSALQLSKTNKQTPHVGVFVLKENVVETFYFSGPIKNVQSVLFYYTQGKNIFILLILWNDFSGQPTKRPNSQVIRKQYYITKKMSKYSIETGKESTF